MTNLEYAGHDDFHKAVAHKVGGAHVLYATGKQRGKRQMLLFLLEKQLSAIGGQAL